MLLQDFVYIERPATTVVARLQGDPRAWLSDFAQQARLEGDALRMSIGPELGIGPFGNVVSIVCSAPLERGDVTVVPITWQAGGMLGAFPTLDGDLEVAALGPQRCQVTLTGRYEPPLGAIGRRLDQLLLHRVAQASVRSFLGRMARSLEEQPIAVA